MYLYTGIHHSDIIVFKKLRFHPLTRLQQNSVNKSWTKIIFLVNTRLVQWPQKPVLKAAFLFNTLKAIVDISMHISTVFFLKRNSATSDLEQLRATISKILNFFSRDRHNFDSSEIPIDSLTL